MKIVHFVLPFVLIAHTAIAQTAATPQNFIQQNASGNASQKLQQALAAGILVSCVSKQAGRERTQAFYADIQATGKQVSGLCKTGQAEAARSVVLAKLDEKKNDPMLPIIHTCYEAQAANVAALSSPQIAAEIATYERWAMNPEAAKKEMRPDDICKVR